MRNHVEMVLHKHDDRLDFRPHNLRLGTRSENARDAHNNGKHDGTESARMKCASYINDVFEKEHASQSDAMRYLISKGFEKAALSGIRQGLSAYQKGKNVIRYERTWKIV